MSKEELIQSIIESAYKIQRPGINVSWKEFGLSHAQVGMLYLLAYRDSASAKDISEHLGITKSAITQLLDPLVEKGLVSRQVDHTDRRIVRLHLTGQGKSTLKKLAKHKFAGLRAALESLTDQELKQLQTLHKKMADAAANK
jgi:DNA-binding MarR family transcriptional regulator